MSIVMTHDTDNGNRCVVYSEKEYLNREYDKKPEQCVSLGTSPITVRVYMYLMATEWFGLFLWPLSGYSLLA